MKKLLYQGLCFLSIVLFLASSMLTAYSLAMSKAVFAHCLVGGVFLIIGLSLSIRYSQFMALNQSVVGIEPDNAKSIELHRNWERLFISEFLIMLMVALVGVLVFWMAYYRLFIENTTLFD